MADVGAPVERRDAQPWDLRRLPRREERPRLLQRDSIHQVLHAIVQRHFRVAKLPLLGLGLRAGGARGELGWPAAAGCGVGAGHVVDRHRGGAARGAGGVGGVRHGGRGLVERAAAVAPVLASTAVEAGVWVSVRAAAGSAGRGGECARRARRDQVREGADRRHARRRHHLLEAAQPLPAARARLRGRRRRHGAVGWGAARHAGDHALLVLRRPDGAVQVADVGGAAAGVVRPGLACAGRGSVSRSCGWWGAR